MHKYDQFKSYYGEILYRWNFITQFAEVEKYIARKSEQSEALGERIEIYYHSSLISMCGVNNLNLEYMLCT